MTFADRLGRYLPIAAGGEVQCQISIIFSIGPACTVTSEIRVVRPDTIMIRVDSISGFVPNLEDVHSLILWALLTAEMHRR